MAKIVEIINKCPNCSGKLEKKVKNIYFCPYCNSEFKIEDDDADSNDSGNESSNTAKDSSSKDKSKPVEFNKSKIFNYQAEYKDVARGKDTRALVNTFMLCVDELASSEEILKYIKTKLNKDNEISMAGCNEKAITSIAKRVKRFTDKDETPIIYFNSGILSNGKHGILFTDKRIVFSGLITKAFKYSEISAIKMNMGGDTPLIYINGSAYPSIFNKKIEGAMLALMGVIAFEKDPSRDKILICTPNSEDREDEADDDE